MHGCKPVGEGGGGKSGSCLLYKNRDGPDLSISQHALPTPAVEMPRKVSTLALLQGFELSAAFRNLTT